MYNRDAMAYCSLISKKRREDKTMRPTTIQVILGSSGMRVAKDGDTALMIVILVGMIAIAVFDLIWGPNAYKKENAR